MVLNNIGNKSEISHFSLCLKTATLVIIRCDLFAIIPALFRASENGFVKVEHRRKITIISNEIRKLIIFRVENFTYRKSIVRLEGAVTHFSEKFSDSGSFLQHFIDAAEPVLAVRLIIMHGESFFDVNDSINAESAKTFVQPPVNIFVYFLTKLWILPVQIWLFLMKNMKVLFVGSRKILPHRASEIGTPVGGKFALFFISQIKEVPIFSIWILTGFFEPFMLVRAVIYYKIHKNIHVTFFCLCNQTIHILHGAKTWINVIIIGNIVSLVCQWRTIARRKPDDIHSKILQIIQFLYNSRQIADSVIVCVIKAFRVNLISNFILPPFSIHSKNPPLFASGISLYIYILGKTSLYLMKKYEIMTIPGSLSGISAGLFLYIFETPGENSPYYYSRSPGIFR